MALQPVLLCNLLAATVLAAREWTSGEEGLARGGDTLLDYRWRARHGDWGYGSANGPDHWPAMFPACGGEAQSPVDVQLNAVGQLNCPSPLVVPFFEWDENQLRILNNGHTVQLEPVVPATETDWILRGGPLAGDYELAQIHFHWADNDMTGSEHTMDGLHYAMEMHMVFARQTTHRRQVSYRAHDDLAVLAVFLQEAGVDNPSLAPVVSQLREVAEPGAQAPTSQKFNTAGLLPTVSSGILVYNGSLTTPPCSEVVTWLIFQRPVIVSSYQVAEFRKLKSPDGELTINRRPVQPLNGRAVYWACAEPVVRARAEPLPGHRGAAWLVLVLAWALYS